MNQNNEHVENLKETAIDLALKNSWENAIKINKEILKIDAENVDALNRLGVCFINLQNQKKAARYFKQAKKLDPLNFIAEKNLKLLRSKAKQKTQITPSNYNLDETIKEPSKNSIQKTRPYIKHLSDDDEEEDNDE